MKRSERGRTDALEVDGDGLSVLTITVVDGEGDVIIAGDVDGTLKSHILKVQGEREVNGVVGDVEDGVGASAGVIDEGKEDIGTNRDVGVSVGVDDDVVAVLVGDLVGDTSDAHGGRSTADHREEEILLSFISRAECGVLNGLTGLGSSVLGVHAPAKVTVVVWEDINTKNLRSGGKIRISFKAIGSRLLAGNSAAGNGQ